MTCWISLATSAESLSLFPSDCSLRLIKRRRCFMGDDDRLLFASPPLEADLALPFESSRYRFVILLRSTIF